MVGEKKEGKDLSRKKNNRAGNRILKALGQER